MISDYSESNSSSNSDNSELEIQKIFSVRAQHQNSSEVSSSNNGSQRGSFFIKNNYAANINLNQIFEQNKVNQSASDKNLRYYSPANMRLPQIDSKYIVRPTPLQKSQTPRSNFFYNAQLSKLNTKVFQVENNKKMNFTSLSNRIIQKNIEDLQQDKI